MPNCSEVPAQFTIVMPCRFASGYAPTTSIRAHDVPGEGAIDRFGPVEHDDLGSGVRRPP